jgi:hypothetical protein
MSPTSHAYIDFAKCNIMLAKHQITFLHFVNLDNLQNKTFFHLTNLHELFDQNTSILFLRRLYHGYTILFIMNDIFVFPPQSQFIIKGD